MNTYNYTSVPELSEFFDLIEDNGKITSHRNSDYDNTVRDLNIMALLVSKKWALGQDFGDDDIRQILEVLHGTVTAFEYMKDSIINHIRKESTHGCHNTL